jgi:WD40 repeat protein
VGEAKRDIWLVNSRTGEIVHRLQGQHATGIWCVAIDTQSIVLVSGGEDRTICLWDLATGQFIRRLIGHDYTVTGLVFSPDGSWVPFCNLRI